MPVYGKIIVIKRTGSDGSAFPLVSNTCLIGRDSHCDIRIQLDTVSLEHSRLDVQRDGQILLTNLSKSNPTTLNRHPVKNSVHVCHMDVIAVAERSLRWEFPANSQYYNSPKPATPVKNGSPIAGNWAINSPANLSPEGKSPPFGDHRSFKVTLGTPRPSPGKKSLQKPLSGKKVPFFLSPKPGKHSPKKVLSLKGQRYLSPERIADAPTIDQDSKSSPAKNKSVIASSKKASPKTTSPSVVLKKISPRSAKSSPIAREYASPKTPSPKSPIKKIQTPSSVATPKPKADAKKRSVSKAQRKTSPIMRSKTASPTQVKKTAEKTPSPKSASPKLSPKQASKTTPSPKTPSERRSSLLKITPRSAARASTSATPRPSGRSSTSPRSPKKAMTSASANKSPLRRASGSAIGGTRSLLRRTSLAARSLKVSFGPNLSPEQFDRALPPTTPLRKGGRPPRGSNSIITTLTPDVPTRKAKRSISPAAISPKTRRMHMEKNSTASPKKSPAGKAASPVVSSPKETPEPPKSASRKSSPKVQSATSPKTEPGAPLMEENVVKIFSPASPDSKKSAALRTIHAKLVLSKAVKKSLSPRTSVSSPASAKRKVLSKSRRASDSDSSELKEKSPISRQTAAHSDPRIAKRASLEAMSSDKSFDGRALQTPNGPNEMLVSPMTAQRGHLSPFLLKRMMNASPSPLSKPARVSPRLSGSPPEPLPLKTKSRFPVKSPLSDYTNVEGVKRLMKSPRKSPKSDYTNVEGVERLFRNPQKSPHCDYSNVEGVKRLMRSPKPDANDEERISSPMRVRTYPERSNKLEPVNYLGYEKRTSPGNSESTPTMRRKSLSPRVSSTKKSPVLKRLSSPLASRGISLTIEKIGGKRSRTSFSPQQGRMVLTPVATKLSSPRKMLTPSPPKKLRVSNSPLPVESVSRKSTTPLSKISPKVTPVLRVESPDTQSSAMRRITRSARSAKKVTRNSPGTTASGYTKMLTILESTTPKSRRGRSKKTVDAASPSNNKENDEPLPSSPKEKPVKRSRKTLKSVLKSPETALHEATSPVEASPPVIAKTTRGRQKKLADGETVSNKRKAKPLAESPKELSPPKRSKPSPARSPSPVVARRTRTKAVKVEVSPDVATLSVRQNRKKSSKPVVDDTPLATPRARATKRKAVLEEQAAPNSPKVATPPSEVPRRTRRAATKKASPAKLNSPLATPVAPRRKGALTRSPAKSATATRSSRRTKK